MSPDSIPDSLNVPLPALISLGIEHWRLSRWLDERLAGRASTSVAATARHALRRMHDFLGQCELEVRSMDGHVFDAGLAVRVVDTIEDSTLPPGTVMIAETVSPLVLWRGRVLKSADVVTRSCAAVATPAPQPPRGAAGENP